MNHLWLKTSIVYSVYKYYENLYPVNEAFMFMSNPDEHYTREILMQNSMGKYQQAHIKTKQEFTDAIKYFRPHTVSTQKKPKLITFLRYTAVLSITQKLLIIDNLKER